MKRKKKIKMEMVPHPWAWTGSPMDLRRIMHALCEADSVIKEAYHGDTLENISNAIQALEPFMPSRRKS